MTQGPREPDSTAASSGRRSLTTRGRCLVAGGAAAIVCAILLDERDLLRVGILAVALPLIALVITVGRRPAVAATHRAMPERLNPGSVGTVEVRLTNTGRLRSRTAAVTDARVAGLTDGVRCLIPPLKPRATAVIRYPLTATRRGRFTIGAVTMRSVDPLGLSTAFRRVPSQVEVLVLPKVLPLSGSPTAAGARSAAAGATQAGTAGGDPDVRIRPYTAGDDVRTIAWRASARRDDLVVRTREDVAHGGATVLLDHRAMAHAGTGQTASLEVAVSLAASISVHLLGDDYQLRLTTHRGALLAAGNDVADDVLVSLADITADLGPSPRNSDPRPLICDFPGSTGLVLAVTGSLTDDDTRRLIASRPAGSRAIALVLDIDGWTASTAPTHRLPADLAAGNLRSGGWRAAVVRRGDDLPEVWRAARGMAEAGALV